MFFMLGLLFVCLPQKVLAVSSDEEIASIMSKANQGDAEAQFNLAVMYERGGGGIPRDSKQAFYWYTKAAEQGVAKAQYDLAVMYGRGGDGVPQDPKQEAYWYKKAAEDGYKSAYFYLAEMYVLGQGVPQDYKQAEYWYEKAAEQGDYLAQSRLAEMYVRVQDYKQAVYWYKKIAENGDSYAQYTLAGMYREGKGVPQDYVMAYAWFNFIASKDWSSYKKVAEKSRDEMVEMMSQDQIEKGNKLSKELYEKIRTSAK